MVHGKIHLINIDKTYLFFRLTGVLEKIGKKEEAVDMKRMGENIHRRVLEALSAVCSVIYDAIL